jgi:methyl-accepting chemotaxis protein
MRCSGIRTSPLSNDLSKCGTDSGAEAYALAGRIVFYLAVGMAGVMVVAMALGLSGGRRSVVDPIHALTDATRELAGGNLDYRVSLSTGDEFHELGEAFNRMAGRLKEVQETMILQERHAMFGRIAAGLEDERQRVHDAATRGGAAASAT